MLDFHMCMLVFFALIKVMNVLTVKVREDPPGDMAYWYRHVSKGAWPFSSRDHGWPISDCSSEGLKVCRSPWLLLLMVLNGGMFVIRRSNCMRWCLVTMMKVRLLLLFFPHTCGRFTCRNACCWANLWPRDLNVGIACRQRWPWPTSQRS